ncbi:MAG: hypothetical protein LRY37_01170, partial [Alkalibacterium thalassium]|nr:hypothetical protein [Alkalibacterium thalassium]
MYKYDNLDLNYIDGEWVEGSIDTPTAKAVGFLSALSNAGHFCFVQALSLRVCHHPSHGRAYSS